MSLCKRDKTRKKNRENPTELPRGIAEPDLVFDDTWVPAQCQCNAIGENLAWAVVPVFYWIDLNSFGEFGAEVESIVRWAFDVWEKPSLLRTKRVSRAGDANIRITMSELDGQGGKLGVAYQPKNKLEMKRDHRRLEPPFVGDVIIDNAEMWKISALRGVLLHELGHALGMKHTNGRRDVMNKFFYNNQKLTSNDVEGITRRYGRKGELYV